MFNLPILYTPTQDPQPQAAETRKPTRAAAFEFRGSASGERDKSSRKRAEETSTGCTSPCSNVVTQIYVFQTERSALSELSLHLDSSRSASQNRRSEAGQGPLAKSCLFPSGFGSYSERNGMFPSQDVAVQIFSVRLARAHRLPMFYFSVIPPRLYHERPLLSLRTTAHTRALQNPFSPCKGRRAGCSVTTRASHTRYFPRVTHRVPWKSG